MVSSRATCVAMSLLAFLAARPAQAQAAKGKEAAATISLTTQRRDAAGKRVVEEVILDPAKTAVVVVDMWDRHWCKTYTRRVGNLVPRMNRTLAAARKLGITDVPLICAQELDIEGAMPRVVRILAHIETSLPKSEIAHVYLGAAAALRQEAYRGTIMLEVFYPVERLRRLIDEGCAERLARILAIANGQTKE